MASYELKDVPDARRAVWSYRFCVGLARCSSSHSFQARNRLLSSMDSAHNLHSAVIRISTIYFVKDDLQIREL
jgi:hypothetical protein